MTRALTLSLALLCSLPTVSPAQLPFSTVFKGEERFRALVAKAERENWRALPIGDRTAAVGRALLGTPYLNYTLEIDDRVEAVSANLNGVDCWTLFEISLGFARMLRQKESGYTPRDLLAMIELDRYRGGKCTGSYLSRLHHLEDWLQDNARRGLVRDLTRELGGVRMTGRTLNEMQAAWRHYRYLVHNPSLRAGIAQLENRITATPVYHIPKSRVPGIEKSLRSGDIICISTNWHGGFTSHVGLAYRDSRGTLRFLHASRNARAVILDARLSEYLNEFSSHAGIMVARPLE